MLRCMSRIVVVLTLLIAADAVVCPVLCLTFDTPSHQTSSVPSPGLGCGGGLCSSGLLPVCAEQPEASTPTVQRLMDGHTVRPGLDPTADIDHPTRCA